MKIDCSVTELEMERLLNVLVGDDTGVHEVFAETLLCFALALKRGFKLLSHQEALIDKDVPYFVFFFFHWICSLACRSRPALFNWVGQFASSLLEAEPAHFVYT